MEEVATENLPPAVKPVPSLYPSLDPEAEIAADTLKQAKSSGDATDIAVATAVTAKTVHDASIYDDNLQTAHVIETAVEEAQIENVEKPMQTDNDFQNEDVLVVPVELLQVAEEITNTPTCFLAPPDELLDVPVSLSTVPDDVHNTPELSTLPDEVHNVPNHLFETPAEIMDVPDSLLQIPSDVTHVPESLLQTPTDFAVPKSLLHTPDEILHYPAHLVVN